MTQQYYKRLAESMTNKVLNEAWSDSMPNWMKPRLNNTAYYSDRNRQQKATARAVRMGISTNMARDILGGGTSFDQADYQKPRGGVRGRSLYDAFRDAQIDLQKVQFIEGEPPTNKNDPRIQPPNIGIWNLPGTKQVYAKGINDLEKLRSVRGAGETYDKYANSVFKYLSVKTLADLCEGQFCYIDGKNIPTRNLSAVEYERNEYADWKNANPGLIRGSSSWYYKTDKSGYLVVPSSDRLAKQLRALKAKNWSTWFTQAEENLQDLYNDIGSVFNTQSWKTFNYNFTTIMQDVMNKYQYALVCYQEAMTRTQQLIDRYGENSAEFLREIGDSYFIKGRLEDASTAINGARQIIDKYVLKYIDF